MSSCHCGGRLAQTTYNSIVCLQCGSESEPILRTEIETYNSPKFTIGVFYSRAGRFRMLLRKILGICSGPRIQDPVWRFLAKSAPFRNIKQLTDSLKLAPFKNKNYTDLHAFSKAFLYQYKAPACNTHKIECFLMKQFEIINFLWCRLNFDSFFSYSWLLETFLKRFNLFSFFGCYIKVLQCPVRRKKYHTLWKTITNSEVKVCC